MSTANPIPEHLAGYEWYAPHLAFLRTEGLTPRHDPGDALPRRADLPGASLRDADLLGADLWYANLCGADLRHADLTGAGLAGADLCEADLTSAVLIAVDLDYADLTDANLTGADLWYTHLTNAKLPDNVRAGCTGGYRWVAVAQADGVHLRYGCEWHPLSWWRGQTPALSVKHGHDPEHWNIGPAVAIAAAEELAGLYPVGTAATEATTAD